VETVEAGIGLLTGTRRARAPSRLDQGFVFALADAGCASWPDPAEWNRPEDNGAPGHAHGRREAPEEYKP
jgi:hypothetical protein